MNDFLGNTLYVGDEVVFTYNSGGGLQRGLVRKITPKRVAIINSSTLKFCREKNREESEFWSRLEGNQLLKIN